MQDINGKNLMEILLNGKTTDLNNLNIIAARPTQQLNKQ
jgi:hypothetical protein